MQLANIKESSCERMSDSRATFRDRRSVQFRSALVSRMINIPWKFLCATAALGLLFVICPSLDLQASSLFYQHGHFFLAKNPLVKFVYHAVPVLVVLYALFILGGLAVLCCGRRRTICGLSRKAFLYLLLAFALGPGLMVNTVLKGHVGRARPMQVVQFGGSKRFTPAFVLSDQTKPNGSFVSGHASVGFSIVALSLLLCRRRRRQVLAAAIAFGGVVGLARMAQGKHFLSDIIFAFVFVYLVSYLLHEIMFHKERLSREVV